MEVNIVKKKRLTLIGVIGLTLVLAAALLLPACAAPAAPEEAPAAPEPAEVITWMVPTTCYGGDYFSLTLFPALVESIEDATDGRLVWDWYIKNALIPEAEEASAIVAGTVEAVEECYPIWVPTSPVAGLFAYVSGGLTTVQIVLWRWYGGGDELANELLEDLDVVDIGINAVPAPEVWAHSTRPLNTPEDLKGLKMRTSGDAGEIFALLGAAPAYMSGTEVYESLARGVLDAGEAGGADVNWSIGLNEVADYMYLSPSRVPAEPHAIFVNGNAWRALPSDLQDIVTAVVRSQVFDFYGEQLTLEAEAIQKFIDYGTIVEPLPQAIEEVWAEAATEFYAKGSAADPFYKKVYDSMMDFKAICAENNTR